MSEPTEPPVYAVGEANENGHVMGPAGHFLTPCKACPEADDHPKIHYGNDSYHHDCLPPFAVLDVTRLADTHPQHAAQARIVDAARAGTHGQELRAFIGSDHETVTQPALEALHARQAAESVVTVVGDPAKLPADELQAYSASNGVSTAPSDEGQSS